MPAMMITAAPGGPECSQETRAMFSTEKAVEMRFRREEIRNKADRREARRFAQSQRDAATAAMWDRIK